MRSIILGILLAITATAASHAAERTYPSFPDAVTDKPAWLTNAPFDVDAYFKSPPAGQNAASLYLDALFEFNPDLLICFCPAGEEPQGEVQRRAVAADERKHEGILFEEAYEKDPKSVDYKAVDAWLAKYDVGFQKLAAAQKRPECVFETGVGAYSQLPHAQTVSQVLRAVKWRTRRNLTRQNIEQPIQDVEMLLCLSRDLQRRGGITCQCVSLATDNMCCKEVMTPILQADGIQKEHCDRLLTLLEQNNVISHRRFVEAVRAEYFSTQQALHDLQYHTGEFGPQSIKNRGVCGSADSPLNCLKAYHDLSTEWGALRLVKEKYGEDVDGLPSDHPLVAGWIVNRKLMSDDEFAKEVDAVNQVYASLLKTANLTTRERLTLSREANLVEPLRATKIALFFYDSPWGFFYFALLRGEAELQGTKCLVALCRWQLEHKALSHNLEEMVKEAGMTNVPIDPYSGQPMRMTTVDGQPVIYAVGPDGRDDGGRKKYNFRSINPAGDILFRLPAGK